MRPDGGREQAGEHLDGRGFAGAVGAEEAEELAGVDGKVYVVDGDEVAKSPRQMLGGNGRGVHRGRQDSSIRKLTAGGIGGCDWSAGRNWALHLTQRARRLPGKQEGFSELD